MQQAAELFGREKVLQFVADSLERPGRLAPAGPPPAVLLIGQCGTGKTVLLEQLDRRHRDEAPTARLDLAGDRNATALSVMLNIRQALSRRVARVGAIPFPLLQLGVCALSLASESALAPGEQLARRLAGRDRPSQQILAAAAQAGKLLPPEREAAVTEAVALASWVCSGINRHRLTRHLNWYAGEVGQGDGTPLGPLVRLHELGQQASAADTPADAALAAERAAARREVWQVMGSALLADLRADFGDFRWKHGQRTTNCLLLLDNADTGAGQQLLEAIAKSREANPEPDPLAVVAAQRTRPGPGLVTGQAVPDTDDALRYAAWPQGRQLRGQPPGWCPVLLTGLSAGQLQSVVRGTVLGAPWRDADFVQDLTGGHPAVGRLLATRLGAAGPGYDARFVLGPRVAPAPDAAALDAAGPDAAGLDAARPDAAGPGPGGPDAAGREPGGGGAPDADGDLRRLAVPGWVSDVDLDRMAVCAATPGARGSACTSVFGFLGWAAADVARAREMLLTLMWADGQAGRDLVIAALPRLLLRRRLARDPARWQDVHDSYAAHYGRVPDLAAVQYHRLAQTTLAQPGRLHDVAEQLDRLLAEGQPAADWETALTKVTAAPSALAPVGSPTGTVKLLAGKREPGDRRRAVTRLVAARWLFGDRLFDPGHALAALAATEYEVLDGLVEGDTEVFYQASERFRRIERTWEMVGHG